MNYANELFNRIIYGNMATGNFDYENRCIVITDEDFENGNIPATSSSVKTYRRSTRLIVDIDEDLRYYDIVITCGYYEHACLDFVEKSEPNDCLSLYGYYDFKNAHELHRCMSEDFGISVSTAWRICGKSSKVKNFYDYVETAFEKMDEYLRSREERVCNKIIDRIKKKFGYEEYVRFATASNGETFYEKIS